MSWWLAAAAAAGLLLGARFRTPRETGRSAAAPPAADSAAGRASAAVGTSPAGAGGGASDTGAVAAVALPLHPAGALIAAQDAGFARPDARAAAVRELERFAAAMREKAGLAAATPDFPARGERNGSAYALQAILNGRVYACATHNANSAISIATTPVRQAAPYLLDGAGRSVGLWDAGTVRSTHREFGGRVQLRNTTAAHYHSTHVGGTLGASGIDAAARGMAPAVAVLSYDWDSDTAEMAALAMATPGQPGTIQISNHSYGMLAGWYGSQWYGTWATHSESDGFGLYDVYAATWDTIAYSAPYYLPFSSAGNDRSDNAPAAGSSFSYYDGSGWKTKTYEPASDPPADYWDRGGYDTIPYVGNAKNILTVGAVSDAVTSGSRDLARATMTAFSCWGPTDDGRVKPDVVANGSGLYSTFTTSDSSYASLSGTSMSSPSAAGSAVLLTQLYGNLFGNGFMRASTLKGLIVHTADDLGNAGPDFVYGWGLMNTKAAADHILLHRSQTNALHIVEGALSATNRVRTHRFLRQPGRPVRATLCWTDYPGAARNTLDDRTPVLVHDLDLRVVTPGGITNLPFVLSVTNPAAPATLGDNNRDNVEQIVVTGPYEAGEFQAIVRIDGPLSAPEQSYSLLISGSTLPPEIRHTPLVNTTNHTAPIAVQASIVSETALDTNRLWLVWWGSGMTGYTSNRLLRTSGDVFTAQIPAQPLGTQVRYYLTAAATNGLTSLDPAGGAAAPHRFLVAQPVALTVAAYPVAVGTADPAYGTSLIASGLTVRASASGHSASMGGFRYQNGGWKGTGSVPPAGSSNAVTFVLREPSTVTWQWIPCFQLVQTSTVAGAINTTNWWPVASTAQTVVAPATYASVIPQRFAGWYMDGQRLPDATNTAQNPARGILMNVPRAASALYMPQSRNSDGDGLADWWEYFYFGSTAAQPAMDSDEDGFTNLKEYQDGTDPRDPDSIPSAPSIAHVPLTGVVTTPAPWAVAADVADNQAVSAVTLRWRRNGGAQLSTNLAAGAAAGRYAGAIPAPGVTGDSFSYDITARDAASLQSASGPYSFSVQYPLSSVRPEDFGTVRLPAFRATQTELVISNAGHRTLNWSVDLLRSGFADGVEDGTNGWTHAGRSDVWHVSASKAAAGTHAWFFGSDTAGHYPDNANAALVTPPVVLGVGARLRFMHWIETETPKTATEAWDGGFVEMSTNNGASYFPIVPQGGYPYRIYGHSQSPFPGGTPCFAGTSDWRRAEFDLSAYAARTVRFGFRFGSDGYVTARGWRIDEVEVTPHESTGDWVRVEGGTGATGPAGHAHVAIRLSTTNLQPAATATIGLRIRSNDPLRPERVVPLALHNESRQIDVVQPEHGAIAPTGSILVLSGASTNFRVTAETYYHVGRALLNGAVREFGAYGVRATNVTWSGIASNGVFTAVMDANLAARGAPEWWLAGHGLTNGGFDAEALADRDADGMAAWGEYVAGTDPTDAASVLRLLGVTPRAARLLLVATNAGVVTTSHVHRLQGVIVSWSSASNRLYEVRGQAATGGAPAALDTDVPATPPVNTWTQAVEGLPARFLRIGVREGDSR